MRGVNVDWRGMTGFDLPAVEQIASAVHTGHCESGKVLAERRTLYHDGAYVLEVGERIAGYVLSHPWRFGDPPAFDNLVGCLPERADTYHIHDIALLPVARRIGAGGRIIKGLIKHAGAVGFQSVSLVAANRSSSFWIRFGFTVEEVGERNKKLLSYDADARYMVRRFTKQDSQPPRNLRYQMHD